MTDPTVRGFLFALAAAAGLAMPLSGQGAQTTPMLNLAYVSTRPLATELCVGETETFMVEVNLMQARRPPRGRRPRWRTYQLPDMDVTAVVTSPAVGQVTPTRANTGLTGITMVTFKALKEGSTEVEISVPAAATLAIAPGSVVSVNPAKPNVTVSSCKWHVSTISRWSSPAGFRPTMVSTWQADLDISQVSGTGTPLTVTVLVTNVATGAPIGTCIPTFSTPPTNVDVRASRARNWDVMLSLFYQPVHAGTTIVCPGGAGHQMDVGDPMAAPLLNLRFPRAGGSKSIRHALKTLPVDAPGQTIITVTEVP